MPSYCLELYLPRASAARLEETAGQARLAAEALSTDGIPINYVRTTYLAEDETCFHVFEANSAEDVAEAARRAGLPTGRVTRAVESHRKQ
jgi:Protein of unknown function (DUF4242)